ncbi:MAG TPA: lysylphosphatidylglycerol synthase domain-containing protein [Mycobacteriales bacterium]|nr:lysylphosphatidylglycerol synthase domain-containing protein [Mycobacteriales bacterium]
MTTSRRRYAAVSAALGTVLAVAGLAFVIATILNDRSAYGDVLRQARWGWAVLGVALALLGMSALGLVWHSVLAALGAPTKRTDVFAWYQVGNLGKYVPGGVFQVLGRAELATRGGVPRSIAYNSVALSMGATYLCGALLAALLLPFALTEHLSLGRVWWVFLVIPVGLTALHPRVLHTLFLVAEKAFGGSDQRQVPTARTSLLLVARHAPGWLLNGLACYAVALALTRDAPFLTIMFAAIASWVAGFLVVVVPGGIGVREAVFVAVVQTTMPGGTAATIALASRLAFVSGDLLGAGLALLSPWRVRRARAA